MDAAIDKFISENFDCSREDAISKLISKRGKSPSILTLIGKKVLPDRHSRSVYSYYRRHLLSHKAGKWSDYELLILLKSFFLSGSYEGNSWKAVSRVLNRSPEQVHDKFREIKPFIHNYRALVTDPNLSDSDKVSKIATINRSPPGVEDDDAEGVSRVSDISEHQQEIYDYIRSLMLNTRRLASLEKIPWSKVQEKFPGYSTSKLRIHFNMSLLPKVYRKVYPEFSGKLVSRLTIRWIRKLLKRPNSERLRSLKDIDFKSKFPMLPVIYTTHCTRRALSKIIRKYQVYAARSQRLFIDSELSAAEVEELKKINPKNLGRIFSNKYIRNIIKFGYSELEVKHWKLHDKNVLRCIKNNILPECTL
ncbi:uncharacterized protein TOT_010001339 [Theileria orientalis strain Shintoku]|uniref:Myb-like domain-containing protein n=1 Tax=Theileria orientalis strain Shintoku TaxID=869250 RepID=J4DNT6_THEOR|nr:uncharacterized protein TOT_010001339 [Theileria orientalis strain Shintoku]BAM39524.1 uncharacterized protein TOT_010001339 [Theileria orientalis strain Shintoku]|eukprot:XP_009689825.1 uncharacterized protein TOT_010001339 [Theileria orientalis strain Shintoku]